MRRGALCAGPHACDEAIEVRDEFDRLLRRERCDTCDLDKLDQAVTQHSALTRAFDLDFALTSGIRLTLDELDVEEWRALKMLRIERGKFEAELAEKARNR